MVPKAGVWAYRWEGVSDMRALGMKRKVAVEPEAGLPANPGEPAVFRLPQDARSTHTRLEEVLGWMSTAESPKVVLDLSGPMLASTQLGPAVAIRNAAMTRGGEVRLVITSEHCLGVLRQCQLVQLFDIYTSVAEARSAAWGC